MESGHIFPREELSFDVERVVQKLLKEAPSLKDLTPEQLDTIAKAVVLEDLKDESSRPGRGRSLYALGNLPYAAEECPHKTCV